jgi:hypothetical protein
MIFAFSEEIRRPVQIVSRPARVGSSRDSRARPRHIRNAKFDDRLISDE